MKLLYPGHKAYFDRFNTKPFHTEYTTKYCNSQEPLLYSQVPKNPWSEPRRPTATSRYELHGAAKPTHLRPPFAARMSSYVPDVKGKYIEEIASPAENEKSRQLTYSMDKRESLKGIVSNPSLTTRSVEKGSPKDNLTDCQVLQKLGVSSPHALYNVKRVQLKNLSGLSHLKQHQTNHILDSQSPLPALVNRSVRVTQPGTSTKMFLRPASTLNRETMIMTSHPSKKEEQAMERVAPRPSTLLSTHSKNIRYVRDTCFFHPTEDRKKHYYIVNSNWFSEQRVKIPKNNVFS